MKSCSAVALLCVLAGCSPGTPPPERAEPPRAETAARLNASVETAAVLGAAAQARVFEGARQPAFDSIWVLEKLGGPIGSGMDFTAPSSMADFERAAVERALVPLRVQWSSAVAMPVPSLTFAVPLIAGDRATVVAVLRCGVDCDRAGIVELQRVDGAWRVQRT